MLNRLTVSALLQSVIALLAVCVVSLLVTTAWQSWERLRATGNISAVAQASTNAFKAMHNLRTDRSSTPRVLNGEAPVSPEIDRFLHGIHDAEMPAIRSTAALLPSIPFRRTGQPGDSPEPAGRKALGAASRNWDQLRKPKKARRAALSREYTDVTGEVLATLERISANLAASVNHNDPLIDHLLSIKRRRGSCAIPRKGFGPGRGRPGRHRQPAAGSAAELHQMGRRHRECMERAGIPRSGACSSPRTWLMP